jgi:hypothetical protein
MLDPGILFPAGDVMTHAVVHRPVQVATSTLLALHAQIKEKKNTKTKYGM